MRSVRVAFVCATGLQLRATLSTFIASTSGSMSSSSTNDLVGQRSGSPAVPDGGGQPQAAAAATRAVVDPDVRRDNLSGIGFMIFSVTAFSCMDAIGKWVAADRSVFQMLAVRSSVATVILLALLPFVGGRSVVRTGQPWGHALRSLLGLGAFTFFFAGLRAVPLADGVLVAFGSPFILTALSVPILGERVGIRQWVAVVLGFAGVVLIVGPNGSGIRPEAILVVMASVCYALTMIFTRLMTRGERSSEKTFTFVFYQLGGQALCGLALAPYAWQPLPLGELGLLAAMGILGLVANFGLTVAFRRAQVAVVAPFEYVALIWATLFGFFIFGDFPSLRVWLGAALIVAAGLYAVALARGRG